MTVVAMKLAQSARRLLRGTLPPVPATPLWQLLPGLLQAVARGSRAWPHRAGTMAARKIVGFMVFGGQPLGRVANVKRVDWKETERTIGGWRSLQERELLPMGVSYITRHRVVPVGVSEAQITLCRAL
jgi:hypothetical protein